MKEKRTLAEFKRDMRVFGFTVKVKTYSDFKATTVFHGDRAINRGDVVSPEDAALYREFFDYRAAHSVTDWDWRVVI